MVLCLLFVGQLWAEEPVRLDIGSMNARRALLDPYNFFPLQGAGA
jgi:hypothetical protein